MDKPTLDYCATMPNECHDNIGVTCENGKITLSKVTHEGGTRGHYIVLTYAELDEIYRTAERYKKMLEIAHG